MIHYFLGSFATLALFGTLFLYFGILIAELLKLPCFSMFIFAAFLLIIQYLAFPPLLDRIFRDAVWQGCESPHSSLLSTLRKLTRLKKIPRLGIVDCTYPILCSYGWWRGHLRIVASTGLIELLSSEELECMLLREIQHLESGDFIPLMLTGAFPCLIYNLSKLFLSLAMHFRFVRGVRTMSSLGIALMYVRKLLSFFVYFASRARERRLDALSRSNVESCSLYSSSLEKIRASELRHGDIPWSIEQKTLALNFLSPLDCWETIMESLFHIPPGSPLAAINLKQERHTVWSLYFELFSSHPLWSARLGTLPGESAAAIPGEPGVSITLKSEEIAVEKKRKRNFNLELAIYLSPFISSLASILLIIMIHGGLMGLPFLLGGATFLAVLLFHYPLSSRSLTPLSTLMTEDPSALQGYPVILKGKVYYDGRQSIVPLCLFFENEVIALPLTLKSFFPLELPATGLEAEDQYEVRGWMRRNPYFHIEIKSLHLKGKRVISSALPACTYFAALSLIVLGIFLLALQMKGGF